MGGCCGKGAAPSDADKTPYNQAKKPRDEGKQPATQGKQPASTPATAQLVDEATTVPRPELDQVQADKQEEYDVPRPIKASPVEILAAEKDNKPPPIPTTAIPEDSDDDTNYPETKPYEIVDLKLGKHPFAKNATAVRTDDIKAIDDDTTTKPEAAPRTTSLQNRDATRKAYFTSPTTTTSSPTTRYDLPSPTTKYDVPRFRPSEAKSPTKPLDETKTSDISFVIIDTPKPADRTLLSDRARPAPSQSDEKKQPTPTAARSSTTPVKHSAPTPVQASTPTTKTSFSPFVPYAAPRKTDITEPKASDNSAAKTTTSPEKVETATSPLTSPFAKSPPKTGQTSSWEPTTINGDDREEVTEPTVTTPSETIPDEKNKEDDTPVNGADSVAISGALKYLQDAEDEITKMQEESSKGADEMKPTVVVTTTTTKERDAPETLPKPIVTVVTRSTEVATPGSPPTTPGSPPATKSAIPIAQAGKDPRDTDQGNKVTSLSRTTSEETNGTTSSSSPPKELDPPPVVKGNHGKIDADNSVRTSPVSPTIDCTANKSSLTGTKSDQSPHSPTVVQTVADDLPSVVSPPVETTTTPPSFPKKTNGVASPSKHIKVASSSSVESNPPEPVHLVRMRSATKELFADIRPSSDAVIGQHELCANTRVKHLQTITSWLNDETPCSGDEDGVPRSMVIVGRPGIGKTCLAAEVVRRYGAQIAGYHFFDHNSAHLDHNDPRAALLSLAHHLCDVFPNYVAMLPAEDKLEALLAQGNVGHLYDALIARPLMSPGLEHDPERRMLIVIDALDECSAAERDAMLDVVNEFNDNSPAWLYLLVTTTTPGGQVDDDLENIVVLEMKTTSENLVDIKRYLKEPLGRFMDRISLDGGLSTLAKKTHGNFLCARLYASRLASMASGRQIALRDVDKLLPTGLGETLREVFRNFRELLAQDASTSETQRVYGDVVGMLALAREPLHRSFVSAVCGDDIDDDALFVELSDVLCSPTGSDHVCFLHRAIGDWLLNESKAGDCAINRAAAQARLADMCTDVLSDVVGDNQAKREAFAGLRPYALKHSIEHLTDSPKRQATIARLLCSMTYIADKVKLDDVNVRHVIADYAHEHYRAGDDANLVTLNAYMAKHPKLADDIGHYAMFMQRKGGDMDACSESVHNVAANYPSCPAIAAAGRAALAGRPWFEELTALPLTSCLCRPMRAHVCGFDVSPDCKTVAVMCKDDDYNLTLRLISTATLDDRVPPVDVKDVSDRVGLAVRFMPDNTNVFVGSLSTYVTTKGREVKTGYETSSIDLTERYSIECCDVSAKYFACALTTFPWGGRSLHVTVFDQRTKRCLRTLEVLRFRFGGSAQFGVRCCAVSDEHHLMCVAVKQTTKPELKVYVWDTTRWAIIASAFVEGESMSKCTFVSASTVMLGSGVRSTVADKYDVSAVRVRAVVWNFRSGNNDDGASCSHLDNGELTSVFCNGQGATTSVSWDGVAGSAVVSVWRDANIPSAASDVYRIRGLPEMLDLTTCGKMLTFVSSDELRMYRFDDLEAASTADDDTDGSATLANMKVYSISFQSRADIAFLVHADTDDTCSVSMMDVTSGSVVLASTPFRKEPSPSGRSADHVGQFRCFRGPKSLIDVCCATTDGKFVVFNSGRRIKVWSRDNDSVTELPETPDEQCDEFAQCTRVSSLVAPKDATVAIIYGQLPFRVFFYDLKSGRQLRKLGLHGRSDRERVVSDMTYLPSTGFLATYHRDFGSTLAVWNPRNGQQINKQELAVGYAKASPASDRIVVSLTETDEGDGGGSLLLRNADGRFRSTLQLPAEWPTENEASDVEFSADGTVLVGVCVQAGVCRVWNAGNGEVLRDLNPGFLGDADIIGMPTNTHVLFHDERILVVDIASGDVVVKLPVDQLERKFFARGVRIAPRGSLVIGADAAGHVSVFLCHNFAAVQRSSTLQRMKSITKKA